MRANLLFEKSSPSFAKSRSYFNSTGVENAANSCSWFQIAIRNNRPTNGANIAHASLKLPKSCSGVPSGRNDAILCWVSNRRTARCSFWLRYRGCWLLTVSGKSCPEFSCWPAEFSWLETFWSLCTTKQPCCWCSNYHDQSSQKPPHECRNS